MKHKYIRVLVLPISIAIASLTSSTVLASSQKYQTLESTDSPEATRVKVINGSNYRITIPKKIIIDYLQKKSDYIVKVTGDLGGQEYLQIVPDETVNLYSPGKKYITGTIEQTITKFRASNYNIATASDEILIDTSNVIGHVNATKLTAGKWSGKFNFNVLLVDEREKPVIDSSFKDGGSYVVNKVIKVNPNETLKINDEEVELVYNDEENIYEYTFKETGTYTIEVIDEDEVSSGKITVSIHKEFVLDSTNYSLVGIDTLSGDIEIPESFEYEGETYAVTEIAASTFKGNTKITGVSIPSSVETIGNYAFDGCTSLTSLKLSEGLVDIGSWSFRNCSALKMALVIPDSVESIGNMAFYSTGITSLTLGKSVTKIDTSAFNTCESLTGEVVLPDGLTELGNSAFYKTNITSIVFNENLKKIGSGVFSNCIKLTELSLPDGLETIGATAFTSCTGLKGELIIPDSVTTIGASAFASCSGLASIKLSSSLTAISNFTFRYCSGLTGEIVIPDSVTSIGTSAFMNDSKITNIVVSDSVKTIGTTAFKSVKHVQYSGTATGSPWGATSVN